MYMYIVNCKSNVQMIKNDCMRNAMLYLELDYAMCWIVLFVCFVAKSLRQQQWTSRDVVSILILYFSVVLC